MRLYIEFEYTHQNAYYFWGETETNIYGGGYPYTYYEKLIGSTLGSDATGYTFGGILNETDDSSDSFLIRYLQLNQINSNSELNHFECQDVLWLSISRAFNLPRNIGKLSGQLGYLYSVEGTGLKSSPSFYLSWTKSLS